jgi:zinc-binding alcohol dehydrogenase/oxidoreductase
MKAIVLEAADKPPVLKEVDKPSIGAGDVLVQIKAAALITGSPLENMPV